MNTSRHVVSLLACSAALLAGCMASDVQDPVEMDELESVYEPQASGGLRDPPAGSNGDLPACLWAADTQEALRTLANSPLDPGSNGMLPSMPLIAPQCREILHTAVKCALSKELAVEDADTGEVYGGWWGLAPTWLKYPLDTVGRRWVTACMIEKLNYLGVKVPILLEGRNPAINTIPAFDAAYPYDESTAFGGDMFSSTTPVDLDNKPPFRVYVCSDTDLVTTCGNQNAGSNWLQYRICDGVGNRCGMTFVGQCSAACVVSEGYWKCRGTDGVWYSETIHVQLEGFGGMCI